jgi:type II secretory pathway pseudopilin PulG
MTAGEAMTNNLRRRSAFTLVEMLVASALIIFMMYIIASAFEKALESFRVMKVQGDLQDKLRAAATTIRLDLTAQHFGDGSALSDQRLNDQAWQPPTQGYFRISQPAAPVILNTTGGGIIQTGTGTPDGVDPDNPSAPYYRLPPITAQNLNPAQNFYLQFTVNMTNGHPSVRDARARRDEYFSTDTYNGLGNKQQDGVLNPFSAPDYNVGDISLHPTYSPPSAPYSTLFTSYWAEVTYFVKPQSPAKYTDATGAVPLYNLYRRQALLVNSPTTNTVPTYPTAAGNSLKDMSVSNLVSQQLLFNRPTDATEPVRRWGMLPAVLNTGGNPPPPYGQTCPARAVNGVAILPPFQNLYEEAIANVAGATSATVYADPLLGPRIGGDLLLTNVVNFEVKVLWEPVVYGPNTSRFFNPQTGALVCAADGTPPQQAVGGVANPDYPFDYLPFGTNPGINLAGTNSPRVFDTWSSNRDTDQLHTPPLYDYIYGVDRTIYPAAGPQPGLATDPNFANWNVGHFMPLPGMLVANSGVTATNYTIPLRVRVRALQIKLRIWDQKTSQTRQMTIIQDM